ncbi:MAG: hypothetical protein ACK55I_43935, partial [bacterium]
MPLAIAQEAAPVPQKPLAVWSFDKLFGDAPAMKMAHEPVAGIHVPIQGFPTLVEGVSGTALK